MPCVVSLVDGKKMVLQISILRVTQNCFWGIRYTVYVLKSSTESIVQLIHSLNSGLRRCHMGFSFRSYLVVIVYKEFFLPSMGWGVTGRAARELDESDQFNKKFKLELEFSIRCLL